MIEFHYELDFELQTPEEYTKWITRVISSESHVLGELSYIFCNDDYLLKINKEYLNHDTYTDVISFQYTENQEVNGDIFISLERIRANAEKFNVEVLEELKRVMAHGLLHILGYSDKSDAEAEVMRRKEAEKLNMFHVEQ